MDTSSPVFRLQLITLIDSICFGLIYAFISPHLLLIGGDHLTLGILSVTILICQLLSDDVAKVFMKIHGKRFALFIILNINMISHLMIALTANCWLTIVARCIFSLTNQSHTICRDLLIQKAPKDEINYYLSTYSVLSSSGYIIGPIITGCLFDLGFSYTCLLAAVLTFFCIFIAMTIPKENDSMPDARDETPLVKRTVEKVAKTIDNFTKSNYEGNWDVIACKFLFISSMTVFFSKFTQLLKFNHNADAIAIGYTTSYTNAVMFAATYCTDYLFKDVYLKYPTLLLAHYSLLVLLLSLIFACYTTSYYMYLIVCIPLIFSRSYINTIWNELFSERKNDHLYQINSSVGIVAGMTVPILFGITCNVISYHAVMLYSILPIIGSLYIVNQYICNYDTCEEFHEVPGEYTSDKNKNE